MKRFILFLTISFTVIFLNALNNSSYSKVLGMSSEDVLETPILQQTSPTITTPTSFEEKEIKEEEEIEYETKIVKDEELEVGTKETKQKGQNGKIIRTYLATLWYGKETARELINTDKTNPVDEIILAGTKIVWNTVSTAGEKKVEESELKYWKKIDNVWATSYDKSCYGCDEYTAVGAKLDYGVCAVDPKVIRLYTTIFVPGYGICQALDVGGAIKGNKIDVGFYDLHAQSAEVGWRGAHFLTIYLLDSVERNLELLEQ